ncbi:hypothetical protein ONZ51_g13491 [Trametes cubensis]|uniref:Uncharacterized protein n=1 Tax=Trametes cubensis TaxID=1111947 RepID=A0AAD7TE26_9APHY|nr:hypothetical protein ONZ51_g13491 [Trametes cubensis]
MSTTPSSAPDDTLGAILVGTFISLVIYGITLHQAYEYFRRYPQDTLLLKVLVRVALPAVVVLAPMRIAGLRAHHSCDNQAFGDIENIRYRRDIVDGRNGSPTRCNGRFSAYDRPHNGAPSQSHRFQETELASRTDSRIDILIMYSVNTGLLTGLFNLLIVVFVRLSSIHVPSPRRVTNML